MATEESIEGHIFSEFYSKWINTNKLIKVNQMVDGL